MYFFMWLEDSKRSSSNKSGRVPGQLQHQPSIHLIDAFWAAAVWDGGKSLPTAWASPPTSTFPKKFTCTQSSSALHWPCETHICKSWACPWPPRSSYLRRDFESAPSISLPSSGQGKGIPCLLGRQCNFVSSFQTFIPFSTSLWEWRKSLRKSFNFWSELTRIHVWISWLS